ncbi:MAG: hypothetical protein ACI4EA_03290 [Candidatus Ornithomonoglobus sp.]
MNKFEEPILKISMFSTEKVLTNLSDNVSANAGEYDNTLWTAISGGNTANSRTQTAQQARESILGYVQ